MNCYMSKDIEELKKRLTNENAKKRMLIKIPALLDSIKDKKFFGSCNNNNNNGDDKLCALDFYFAETCENILKICKELELEDILSEE